MAAELSVGFFLEKPTCEEMYLCLYKRESKKQAINEVWQEKLGRWGQNRKCNRIHEEKSLNKIMRNIINHGEWCITSLHYILPAGKGKNFPRFHEFRQIICPLKNQRQNKQTFGKSFKIQIF